MRVARGDGTAVDELGAGDAGLQSAARKAMPAELSRTEKGVPD